jgi:tetratricopeptide (TPR) repeat protein
MDSKIKRLLALGQEHYNNGDYAKAEKLLSKALRDNPGFADVQNMLGVIYYSQARLPQARTCFERAVEINPAYTEASLNLAVTYNDLGLYAEAKQVYSQALAQGQQGGSRDPADVPQIDPFAQGKLANMHADLGDAYHGLGLFADAVREYHAALRLCPTFVDIRTKLANACRDQGEIDAAIQHYREVETMNPSYVPARVQLGVALFRRGNIDEARRELEQVLTLDPSNRSARFYLKMINDGGDDTSSTTPSDR